MSDDGAARAPQEQPVFRAAIDQLMNDKVAPLLMALAFGGALPWAITKRASNPLWSST